LTTAHQASVPPVLARQQFDDDPAFAMAANSHNKPNVTPLHQAL
jgi:hypothetical protein